MLIKLFKISFVVNNSTHSPEVCISNSEPGQFFTKWKNLYVPLLEDISPVCTLKKTLVAGMTRFMKN